MFWKLKYLKRRLIPIGSIKLEVRGDGAVGAGTTTFYPEPESSDIVQALHLGCRLSSLSTSFSPALKLLF